MTRLEDISNFNQSRTLLASRLISANRVRTYISCIFVMLFLLYIQEFSCSLINKCAYDKRVGRQSTPQNIEVSYVYYFNVTVRTGTGRFPWRDYSRVGGVKCRQAALRRVCVNGCWPLAKTPCATPTTNVWQPAIWRTTRTRAMWQKVQAWLDHIYNKHR